MLFDECNECIPILESNGYIIVKPIDIDIKGPKDLAKYFYTKVRARYGTSYRTFNWKLETSYAKTFILQLSASGKTSDSIAIGLAKDLIDVVFDNIDYYEQYFSIRSLNIFIADATLWVVEKAQSLLEDNIANEYGYSKDELEIYEKEYSKYLADTGIRKTDLLDKLNSE